jgi:beta-phosphoglucomutase-like phosphatase (HAD superfamily)
MIYKGMIFDFNGVLLVDSDFNEIAWKSTINILLGNTSFAQQVFENLKGRNNRQAFEILLKRKIEDDELDSLSELKEKKYRELCLQKAPRFKLNDGAIELFEFLKSNHIRFTIATAAGENNLDFYIKHLKLDHWFNISNIVYDDGLHPGKPAPDSYILAAQKINLPPKDCVVIEDSLAGIMAAKSAKIGHIIGYGPSDKHQDLINVGANQAITTFAHFPRNIFQKID